MMGNTPKCSLLVVDDELYILPTLTALLGVEFDVLAADSVEAAQDVFARQPIDLILTDQKMPRQTGIQLLEWVHEHHPRTVRLLMTGYAELEDAVNAINRGHVYYYLLKPWRTEELLQILRNAAEKCLLERSRDQLLEQLRQLNSELEKRVAERTQALQDANHLLEQRARELERLALTDPLTGLFNRRAMEELARFELKRHTRYPHALTIGLIDIDRFKDINTQYLLPGGDEALKGLARILTHSLREVDSVGRIGGDEFLIIARETNQEGATRLAERIRATVAETPIPYGPHTIRLSVSVSFAVADANVPADFDSIYRLAAGAIKDAKDSGRNCFAVCLLQGSGVGVQGQKRNS
ncbi:MAG TPA: diguanylate cyclase [Gemmataceae bacterium]|jgi:diguanylate cyclase (GGDEF)-like protein